MFKTRLNRGIAVLIAMLVMVVDVNAQPLDPSVVILFGDSISVGFNVEENYRVNFGSGQTASAPLLAGSRPTQFMNVLLNSGTEPRTSVVVNWGVGGSNTISGLNRITANLQTTRNQIAGRNYYVLIMYGTNDVGGNIPASVTGFNVREMVRRVQQLGPNFIPVVANITPRDDFDVTSANSAIVSQVNALGLPVVDMFRTFIFNPAGFRNLLSREFSVRTGLPIQLHPNVPGYLLIAQTWIEQSLNGLIAPDASFVEPEPPVIAPILHLLLDD